LVDTGRLSSGGKNKDTGEKYINFQNIPADEETRECFIASEGYILCDCDYTAQEDLVFTELSQEPKLIDFYNDKTSKRDGHSFVAKICYPDILKDIEEINVKKEFPKLRANAKKAKFAIN
jgi:DNA polymerase I-like protein with 3'-5' exonuclease and polymerase domains